MSNFSFDLFEQIPFIGIIRGVDKNKIKKILKEFQLAGLTTVEITLNTPNSFEMIKESVNYYGTSLNIGAGTVCTMTDLILALKAGAQFIVTPILNPEIVSYCKEHNIPVFPGAFTPTEIYQAWVLGATMVKVFPGNIAGADYLMAIKGPLDQIKLMPTGGIGLNNLNEFLGAGVDAIGFGSAMMDQNLIDDENWEGLNDHFKKFVTLWNNR